jgi:hypothetical protein
VVGVGGDAGTRERHVHHPQLDAYRRVVGELPHSNPFDNAVAAYYSGPRRPEQARGVPWSVVSPSLRELRGLSCIGTLMADVADGFGVWHLFLSFLPDLSDGVLDGA